MTTPFGAQCDDFYVTCRLNLKLGLSVDRETTLSFFDRLGKDFPKMRKLRRRDDGVLILEEPRDEDAARRWVRLDGSGLRFGCFAPEDLESVLHLSSVVLEHAPYYLTFSDLDYEYLEAVFGFDLLYRGNHDRLVAETFFSDNPLGVFLEHGQTLPIDVQPYLGIALNPECDQQAYLEFKSRTTTYEIRTGEFEPEPLGVLLTLRSYWGLDRTASLTETQRSLIQRGEQLASRTVVPHVVNPLAQAIATRLD